MDEKEILLDDIRTCERTIDCAIWAIESAIQSYTKHKDARKFESYYVEEKFNEIKKRQARLRSLDAKLKHFENLNN
jgi:hypothetical protein